MNLFEFIMQMELFHAVYSLVAISVIGFWTSVALGGFKPFLIQNYNMESK